MITDPEAPEMRQAAEQLQMRLNFLAGGPTSKGKLQNMLEAIDFHRKEWRNKGVDFPELRPLVIPRLNIIDWIRADLAQQDVQMQMRNFILRYYLYPRKPYLEKWEAEEVQKTFKAAFPHLNFELAYVYDVGENTNKHMNRRFQ